MVKRFTAWLLIIASLSANYSRLVIYAGFKLNQDYIATKLCENRAKPWMHCNGRCYLMKKLKAAADKQAANERETQKDLFQEAIFADNTHIKFFTTVLQTIPVPNRLGDLPKGHLSIFRPPQLG